MAPNNANATSQENFRHKKRSAMGDEAYKKQENEKRKQRRQAQLKREKAMILESDEYDASIKQYTSTLIKIAKDATKNLKDSQPLERPAVAAKKQVKEVTTALRLINGDANCAKLTADIIQVVEEFKQANPGERAPQVVSIKGYVKTVTNLAKMMGGSNTDCSDFEFLRDVDGVKAFLFNKYPNKNTRGTKLTHIASILKYLTNYQTEFRKYSKMATEVVKENALLRADNLLTENEKGRFMKWSAMKTAFATLTDKTLKAIMGLYVLNPPRRLKDFRLMKLHIMSVSRIKSGEGTTLDRNFNHLLLPTSGTKAEFVFNNYKTAPTYKQVTFAVAPGLVTLLRAYIKDKKKKQGDFLFSSGETQFRNLLVKALKKATNGEFKHGSNGYRHSYISSFMSKNRSQAEIREAARWIGNSEAQFRDYNRLELDENE